MVDVALALRVVPLGGKIIKSIVKIALEIRQKVKEVKANQRRCATLSERIDRIADHLNSNALQKKIESDGGGPMERTLKRFEKFLGECYEYISLFVDMLWIEKFLFGKAYKEQFQDFNEQLNLYFGEFSMGLNIQNFVDKVRDERDKREDQCELELTIATYKQQNIESTKQLVFNKINNLKVSKENIFIDGTWTLRYSIDDVWHGPFKQTINFHPSTQTFDGEGKNKIGEYTLKGTYSTQTNQLDFSHRYKQGTGNPYLNNGQECQYQLKWNEEKRIFEGVQYARRQGKRVPVGNIEMSLSTSN